MLEEVGRALLDTYSALLRADEAKADAALATTRDAEAPSPLHASLLLLALTVVVARLRSCGNPSKQGLLVR